MGILPIRELARILRATLSGGSGLPPPRLTGPKRAKASARTMRVGRKALGRVSLGYFSLHEQREVTRSPEASGSLGFKKTKTGFQLALE